MTIIKTKRDDFLIGNVDMMGEKIRIHEPFEIFRTEEGVSIRPHDFEMIGGFIPYIDIKNDEYIYTVQPSKTFEEFYEKTKEDIRKELINKNQQTETPEGD